MIFSILLYEEYFYEPPFISHTSCQSKCRSIRMLPHLYPHKVLDYRFPYWESIIQQSDWTDYWIWEQIVCWAYNLDWMWLCHPSEVDDSCWVPVSTEILRMSPQWALVHTRWVLCRLVSPHSLGLMTPDESSPRTDCGVRCSTLL